MNLKEAYSILELPEGTDAEAAKKKYRELTKKYHPDVNKDPGAEDKFKKINEAYQIVSTGKDTELNTPYWNSRPQSPFTHIVNSNIMLNTTISFKESIIGSKTDLKYNRKVKCATCSGNGGIKKNNGCDRCGGNGMIVNQQGHSFFARTCDKCHGQVSVSPCNECKAEGSIMVETSVSVSIPGGIPNEGVLRLGGMGNYAGSIFNSDQYTDVHLKINVTPISGLILDGMNVVSNLDISLLEALEGCTKKINTIDGIKDIYISPKIKNKDTVKIPKLGVNRQGDQQVIIGVNYPDDVSAVISTLKIRE